MSAQQNKGKWIKTALMTGAVSAWLIYDMATASEPPGSALLFLQYFLLTCALISLVGSLVMLTRND